jgi:hypothetical protein
MAYAAGLAAVVALAGCGDGDRQAGGPATPVEARTSTAVTSPAAPTTTTAPADPVLARIPAAARPNTPKGAEAFARFYFEQVNEAFKRADAARLQDLTTQACELCKGMAQGVTDMAAKRHHYGGDLAKVNFTSPVDSTATSQRVLVDAKQLSVAIVDEEGRKVDQTDAADLRFVATLSYDGRWVITRLQKAKS